MSGELRPLVDRERQIIEPGSEVLGGKLLTRAAFVVDNEENPQVYNSVLRDIDAVVAVRERMGAEVRTYDRLKATFGVVNSVLPMRGREEQYGALLKAEAQSRGVERLTTEHEVGLSRFVRVVGMCHQHSLLSAAMMRLMQERGDFGGLVSVEIPEAHGGPGVPSDSPERHTKAVLIEDDILYSLDTDTGLTKRRYPVQEAA